MNNSKLYSILEHFDKYEQNRCRKYIISPYFNKNQALIDLYDVLIKNINSANSKSLTREVMWLQIHTSKKFDDVRCRKYLSDLLKLIEGYLSQQVFESAPLQRANNLLEGVGDKRIEKLYRSTVRRAKKISESYPYRSALYFNYQYQIEKSHHELMEAEIHRSERANLEVMMNYLDYFYLSEKLRLYCSALTRKRLSSHNYEFHFIQEILKHIQGRNFEDIPAISIYYQIYLTLTDNENEEHYFILKELLSKYNLKFPPVEAYQMYTSAINYCVRKINKGNSKFLQELFEVYRELTESKIVLLDGELSPWTFQNIVVVALRLGRYSWTEDFITNYKRYIPEHYRENAVSYNLARLRFYQKEYENVIELLSEVEYEEISYNLGSKVLLMATYYEIDEVEPLYFLFESFRAYLNRHKDIPLQRRNNYKNLIKLTKKLMKVSSEDKDAIGKLKNEVSNTKGIANVEWLTEKIAELEK